jgi:beta-glucanase (GH16 family)
VKITEEVKKNFRRCFLRTYFSTFVPVPFFVLAIQSSTAAASSARGGVTTLRDLMHDTCVTVAAQSNNAAIAAGSCGASITAQTYQFYQLSDGNYHIYTLSGTTYCLAYSGNTVVSTICANVPSQEWSVQVLSNGMMIEAVGGTSCLADPANWNTSATTVQPCNAATNEVFQNSIFSGAVAACGPTPSGSTVWVNGTTGSSSTAATAQQCPYGGTVTTTSTNQAQELCTNDTLTSTGQTQQVNVVTAAPVCNAAGGPNGAVGNITVLPASQPSQIAPPGATINIGTNFTAVSPLITAYGLTIYLTDSSGNTITSVTDTLNEYDSTVPTTQWQGPINVTRSLTVPSVANGTYQVMVALDNAATSQVLALSPGAGVTQDDQYRYSIGTVTVQASAAAPSLLAPQTVGLTGFTPTFDDEFQTLDLSDGSVYNGSKWYTHNEQCCMQTTDGSGTYMYGMDDPVDPYSIGPGGGLDIRLQEINKNWSSGVITSVDNHGAGFSQQYGYFEMSAQFPSGLNTWPAFWLLNTASKASGAGQGEIDVAEYIANPAFINTIRTTLHDWSQNTAPDFSWNQVTNPSDGNFHTYGMLWTAQSMTFYFDGTGYFSCPTPSIMHQPYYMLVDLGIGSGYPTNITPPVNDMIVQYVRAYSLPLVQ